MHERQRSEDPIAVPATPLAAASRRAALALRLEIAAALGLPFIACSGEPTTSQPAAKDGSTAALPTTSAAKSSAPTAAPSASGPTGWKTASGLYCSPLAKTKPDGDRCGRWPDEDGFADIDRPSGMHGYNFDEAGTARERETRKDACCYTLSRPERGRPLRAGDAGRTPIVALVIERSGWLAPVSVELDVDPSARRRAIDEWTRTAVLEHASVAEFSRVALSLLAFGAPASLIRGAHEAALDEIAHAEIAFGIASALAGAPLGPGPLDTHQRPYADLVSLVRATIEDGCVGESLASVEAAVAAEHASDPTIRAALERIARDEARHARLAYEIVLWALRAATEDERREIVGALGDLGSVEQNDVIWRETVEVVVRPAVKALIERAA